MWIPLSNPFGWCSSLNYRIDIERSEVLELVERFLHGDRSALDTLLAADQVRIPSHKDPYCGFVKSCLLLIAGTRPTSSRSSSSAAAW